MQSMYRWSALTLLAICGLLGASGAYAGAPAEAGDRGEMTVYQFVGERLPAPGTTTEARIEYELDGRTVLTKRFAFQIDAVGKATFLVPDPARVARIEAVSHASADVTILVYAGDTLLDSFDLDGFRAYNAKLRANDREALEPLFSEWSRAEREAPAPRERREPTARTDAVESISAAVLDPCVTACRQEYFDCVKSGYSGCEQTRDWCYADCPNYDSDFDGVANGSDNCVFTANSSQANCDGDSAGDACDGTNAIYQTVDPESTCWTDRDDHFGYFTYEHHVEWLERDVSSCGAPDRWRNRVRISNNCVAISSLNCCLGLDDSIEAVGDDPDYWCSYGVHDINFCH